MILLTESPNDDDLLSHFNGQAIRAPIPHGDFAFFGVWEEDRPVRVCGDRKKVGDLVKCIDDGRHIQQLQQAHSAGFDFQFLVLEGLFRSSNDGMLEVRKGDDWTSHYPNIEYYRLDSYLNQLSLYFSVLVKRSQSPKETVRQVIDLYRLFQSSPSTHNSLKRFHSTPPPSGYVLARPSLTVRVAKELTGIGWDKAHNASKVFPSVRAMSIATEKEWRKVDGIGKVLAKSVVTELRGGIGG